MVSVVRSTQNTSINTQNTSINMLSMVSVVKSTQNTTVLKYVETVPRDANDAFSQFIGRYPDPLEEVVYQGWALGAVRLNCHTKGGSNID